MCQLIIPALESARIILQVTEACSLICKIAKFLQFSARKRTYFQSNGKKSYVKNLLGLFTVLIKVEQLIWHHNLSLKRHCQTSVELSLCVGITLIPFEGHIYGKLGMYIGLSTTLPNIYEKLFTKIVNRFQQLNIFTKKLHHRCLTGFEIRL